MKEIEDENFEDEERHAKAATEIQHHLTFRELEETKEHHD